ncbi:AAA family ATPase [Vibrio alginolyticus]
MSYKSNREWTFAIEQLGNLETGNISIKPLTLLCGPNNTGKTWVMYAIYGFLSNQEVDGLHGIDNIVSNLKENGVYELNIEDWLKKNFKSTMSSIDKYNVKELPKTFSASEELFTHTRFNWKADLDCILECSQANSFEYGLSLGSKGKSAFSAQKDKGSQNITMTLISDMPRELLKNTISSVIYNHLQGRNGHKPFLIPAERNGLHLFYRELSNRRTALLHHASRDELDLHSLLKDVLGSKYAMPIADYIDWLNDLTSIKKGAKKGKYHNLAEEVKKLVGGRYHVDAEGNITFTPKKKRNGPSAPKMDLHLSSSTVKSLFGLWFYLEYQAQENGVLMIDEPELNLHPSNQRAVARLVAKLVNNGIHVIVSTHSDYFLRELNSLIMLGGESGDKKARHNLLQTHKIDEESVLNKDLVGAYVFESSSLQAMEIGDEGIIATTFDQEINELNDSSDDIYYSYVLSQGD